MEFNAYQHQANMTAIYREKKIGAVVYPALKMAGEAGEVAEKVGKWIRDYDFEHVEDLTQEQKDALAKEIGDVLWYCAVLSTDLGYNFSQVAQMNLDKLQSRQERGVLGGSGDDR